MISVVIPVYLSRRMIEPLCGAIVNNVKQLFDAYEIIFVDDGSPDNAWSEIEKLCGHNSSVKGIRLSRNFGQHPAIFAGLQAARGEWIVVMDCDFQDDPAYIPVFLEEAKKGYEIIFAKRVERTDGNRKLFFTKLYYNLFSYLTNSKFEGSIGNYGLYSRKVIDAVLSMREPFKAFTLMARWVGFPSTHIEVKHQKRSEGKSSYTFGKLIKLATSVVLTYSDKPLYLTVRAGLTIAILAVLFAIYNVVAYFTGIIKVVGYASLITSIWFLGGLIIFNIGILGLYIGKIFEVVKERPVFLIHERINLRD